MKTILKYLTSKTVWGALLLAAAQVPELSTYADALQTAGTALGGIGVADKLEKIKKAAESQPKPNR